MYTFSCTKCQCSASSVCILPAKDEEITRPKLPILEGTTSGSVQHLYSESVKLLLSSISGLFSSNNKDLVLKVIANEEEEAIILLLLFKQKRNVLSPSEAVYTADVHIHVICAPLTKCSSRSFSSRMQRYLVST